MGDSQVHAATDPEATLRFGRALLDDLQALERMCDAGVMERGTRRIGFEQELFLVDQQGRPAPVADAVLAVLDDPAFTHEIGRYNIEYNAAPRRLEAGALASLETELEAAFARIREAARTCDVEPFLGGVLPSIDRGDLTLANLTPVPRYHALNDMIMRLAGGSMRTLIQGRDNLQLTLDNVMLESCTTSIQIHLQVDPEELPAAFNIAQVLAAPMVAVSANAPVLLQHRLWHESRIPAFQQAVDIRGSEQRGRGSWQRVDFGEEWVDRSVLEVYRDQVVRHRTLLIADTAESSLAILERGEVPRLRALSLHNGSLYRWNRPCYGITDGRPHLRIEHRPLPAGPTILDEVANTAFFVGLVEGMLREGVDVRDAFRFGDVKSNFFAAARYGLDVTLRWAGGEPVEARTLLLERLLPLAHGGLAAAGISDAERTRYLDVIEARVRSGMTGARWTLDAHEALATHRNPLARTQALTRLLVARQRNGAPVHTWTLPTPEECVPTPVATRVAEIMSTDLFTVRPHDLMNVAASVMEWKHVRHVPVEDDAGALVGLVSHRELLALLATAGDAGARAVGDIMRREPVTIRPGASCAEALELLRDGRLGCLPVVEDGQLVGIVTERDFLPFARAWLSRTE
jgi:CBS domain-containing protein/gamma-glutamyl:cysteine ligase YbdK (ATP-grasp superfamily)